MSNLVRCGEAKKGKFILIGSNVGEKSKEILGVELPANKSTGNVDTAFNILGENGGIYILGL